MSKQQIPKFTISDLMEAGVHFGHTVSRWNPKMAPYIFGQKEKIHIIDLQKTAPLLFRALQVIYEVSKRNGRILFVGTKRQAQDIIKEAANKCGQYYINQRWRGGTLTNWQTISKRLKVMFDLEKKLDPENQNKTLKGYTKKEILDMEREYNKLESSLGGVRNMGGKPDLLFVIDTNKENLAIKEARNLGIPIIAVVDSNSDPLNIDFPIPGNDDATRAIKLYTDLAAEAVVAGLTQGLIDSGIDIGEAADITTIRNLANPVSNKPKKNNTNAKRKFSTKSKPAAHGGHKSSSDRIKKKENRFENAENKEASSENKEE